MGQVHICSFLCCLCHGRLAAWVGRHLCLQSQWCLPSGLLQKAFAKPCSKTVSVLDLTDKCHASPVFRRKCSWPFGKSPFFLSSHWNTGMWSCGALFLLKDVGAPCIGSVYRLHHRPEQPVCGVEAALNMEGSWLAVLCDSVENHCSKGPAGQTLLGRRPVPPPRADLGSPFVIRGRGLAVVCLGCTAGDGGMGVFRCCPSLAAFTQRACVWAYRIGLADPFRSLCCVTPVALV